MTVIKKYTKDEVEKLINSYEENEKLDLVGLYPSAHKFIQQFILAHDLAERKSFEDDIDYDAHTPKRDRYRYGFIKSFSSEEKAFVLSFPTDRVNFDWAVDMFEKCVERLDIDKVTEWHDKMYYTDEVQEEIKIMVERLERRFWNQS